MRIAHILRKYNPSEWGGTETALERMFSALRHYDVASTVYCPRLEDDESLPALSGARWDGQRAPGDPLIEAGCTIRRFKAWMPVWGMSRQQKRQHIAVGGNLMSFELFGALWREFPIQIIHAHTLGRLGSIGMNIARCRKLPFVVTVHGGLLDLPVTLKESFAKSTCGLDWGKPFGALLRSRRLLDYADAVLTCNPTEAALLQEKYPGKSVRVQPHGVALRKYQCDYRNCAREAFPQIQGKQMLLSVGRIDPVKNQAWLIEQCGEVFKKYPESFLVLAGSCTNECYGAQIQRKIQQLGLHQHVLLTGGLPPMDPRLIGLYQEAQLVVLPSLSETFGLVILESWAAGTLPLASDTSGARALIRHGQNGWLFKLEDARTFHRAVEDSFSRPVLRRELIANGSRLVAAHHDTHKLAGRLLQLYEQLIEESHALRNPKR